MGKLSGQGAMAMKDRCAGRTAHHNFHARPQFQETAGRHPQRVSILRSSSTISSGCSMVAGSLSMWVSTESISGASRRISRLQRADEAVRHAQRHFFVEFHMLLDAQPPMERLHAQIRGPLTLLRAATGRMRSKMLSARASRGTVWMTTSPAEARDAPHRWPTAPVLPCAQT